MCMEHFFEAILYNIICDECKFSCKSCIERKDKCISCFSHNFRLLNDETNECQCVEHYFE